MKSVAIATPATLLATPALSHTGLGDPNGFLHGLAHTMIGMDHLLAMLPLCQA